MIPYEGTPNVIFVAGFFPDKTRGAEKRLKKFAQGNGVSDLNTLADGGPDSPFFVMSTSLASMKKLFGGEYKLDPDGRNWLATVEPKVPEELGDILDYVEVGGEESALSE